MDRGLPAASPYYKAAEGEVTRVPGFRIVKGGLSRKSDCWSTKGLLRVPVRLPNGAEFDVYNTHLDAGRDEEDLEPFAKSSLNSWPQCIKKLSKDRYLIHSRG